MDLMAYLVCRQTCRGFGGIGNFTVVAEFVVRGVCVSGGLALTPPVIPQEEA